MTTIAQDWLSQHRCSQYRFTDARDCVAVRMSYDEDNRCLANLTEPSSYFDASRPPSRLMSIKTTSGLLSLQGWKLLLHSSLHRKSRNLGRVLIQPNPDLDPPPNVRYWG